MANNWPGDSLSSNNGFSEQKRPIGGTTSLGRVKRSPSHLGGAKTESLVCHGCAMVFGTSRLRNTLPYIFFS